MALIIFSNLELFPAEPLEPKFELCTIDTWHCEKGCGIIQPQTRKICSCTVDLQGKVCRDECARRGDLYKNVCDPPPATTAGPVTTPSPTPVNTTSEFGCLFEVVVILTTSEFVETLRDSRDCVTHVTA